MEKNLDVTKPRYSKQILPVISRFHCKKLKVFWILTHWKPLELEERYLTYAIGMTNHLERTILMKMADIDTNSPSSLCRFAWLGVQVLDFTRYISCSFFSFWNISFSWLHSMWCSGISIIRIRWKQTSSQNDVKIVIFPIPISFWSVLEIFKQNRGDPEEIGMAGQSAER